MSRIQNLITNPIFRSFMLFSAFRAVYGTGILVVTWFLATSEETPFWVSIVFLMCSMVFSRILFKLIKRKWGKEEPIISSSPDGIIN